MVVLIGMNLYLLNASPDYIRRLPLYFPILWLHMKNMSHPLKYTSLSLSGSCEIYCRSDFISWVLIFIIESRREKYANFSTRFNCCILNMMNKSKQNFIFNIKLGTIVPLRKLSQYLYVKTIL